MPETKNFPLSGVRVLELGQLIAGPFCGMILASFGAEVIKVEAPESGDPMRVWRKMHAGTSLWWYSISRNKKSITLDLRNPEGREIIKKLVAHGIDILIENFRPGRMEEWGLGFDSLKEINPKLIMVRISGWGQDGPYAKRPGFASVAEGIGGIRYITGDPDRPPIRSSISLGDSLAGLHAAFGAMTALYHSKVNGGQGQVVDCAIYESVFNMMESTLPEFDALGVVRERTGARLEGIVPSNTYRCSDGKYVIIGGNNDSIFKRLMEAVGRQDLADDVALKDNQGRVSQSKLIDDAIENWTLVRPLSEALRILHEAEVPAGPIYSIADIAQDPNYLARGMFESVELPDGTKLKIPRMSPELVATPAATQWGGPTLGEHNDEIYRELLGMSSDQVQKLKAEKII